MSNYELLKTAIDAVIKANGRAEITGSIMNQTLIAIVNSLGKGYQFIGVATPEINPNTPDEKVFYLAMQAGTYTNFGNITLNTGLTVLKWDGEWHAATVFTTDTTPTHDSANLITSGAVYNAIKNDGGAYDVSAHFPTGGESGGNTYTLANAIAKVPVNMRKGGMSIKFIDAATNKYVKRTYLNPTTDGFTNVNNWQGIIESAAGFHTIGSAKNHQLASVGALVEEFGIKCVNELPTASASTMNKIYSIPTAHPVAGKRRDEYFTVEVGIAPDYTEVKDLVTVTAIPDNALGAQVGEGKFIANDTTNNKAYYFVSVRALNEWGYEVTVEEVESGKIARMINESQYASNGTAWVIDYHYADYTWESLSPDLSSLATKSEVAEVAHALELTARDCENMTSIEYDELVQLRDDGELIPGKWYRIVDYHTTTAQEDTQSADHQFDVIVRADAVDKLNENAFSAISYGDSYFTDAGAKLEAWELKYCLDNDTNRFAWADEDNGKGVIYWMRDEWGNECPYDFKNIQFKRYKITACSKIPNLIGRYSCDDIDGVDVDTEHVFWCYTFTMIDENAGIIEDVSTIQRKYINDLESYSVVTENKIKSDLNNIPESLYGIFKLIDNVFVTDTELCYFEEDYGEFYGFCGNEIINGIKNTFGNNNFHNNLRNVFNIVCGENCSENIFMQGVGQSLFTESSFNVFEGDSQHLFLQICIGNHIGRSCTEIELNDAGSCQVKRDCSHIKFVAGCHDNIVEKGCANIELGENCAYNHIKESCISLLFGNRIFGCTFGYSCETISFHNNNTVNRRANNVKNVTFEGLNKNVTLNALFNGEDAYLQNIIVKKGTSSVTIRHSTFNDNFCTTYKAQGSQEIEV